MPVDVGERAKAIPLHFVHPIAMIEGLARDGERHRCELGSISVKVGSIGVTAYFVPAAIRGLSR